MTDMQKTDKHHPSDTCDGPIDPRTIESLQKMKESDPEFENAIKRVADAEVDSCDLLEGKVFKEENT